MPTMIDEVDVVRAWIDVEYRDTLSAEQVANLPENPIGDLEVIDLMDPTAACSWCVSAAVGAVTCLTTLACTNPCCAW